MTTEIIGLQIHTQDLYDTEKCPELGTLGKSCTIVAASNLAEALPCPQIYVPSVNS